jgi:hypothetical protein
MTHAETGHAEHVEGGWGDRQRRNAIKDLKNSQTALNRAIKALENIKKTALKGSVKR